MKKVKGNAKMILFLAIVISVILVVTGCGNSTASKATTAKQVEYKTDNDLPKQENIKIQYLTNSSPIQKDFKEDMNYKAIIELIDNFFSAKENLDYETINKDDVLKIYNYVSNNLKQINTTDAHVQSVLKNIKDNKIQSRYCKTNINNVIFNFPTNSYFIDCTFYTFVKNNIELSDQNKYYQQRYYLNIINENGSWVVNSFEGYSGVRAEEAQTMYMLDLNLTKSVFVQNDESAKLKDLEAVKGTIRNFFNVYYSEDYNNTSNFKNDLVGFSSANDKNTLSNLADGIIKDINSRKVKTIFKDAGLNFINYSSFDNSYWITADAKWSVSQQDGSNVHGSCQRYYFMHLIDENNSWKIDKIYWLSPNLEIGNN